MIIDIGDAIVVLGDSLLSEAIAKLTGPVSHIGMVSKKTCNEPGCTNPAHWEVTQALSDGIKTLTLAGTMATARYGYCLHDNLFALPDRQKMVAWGLKQIGVPYAFKDLALEAIDAITRTETASIYFDENGADICSQYYSMAAIQVGRSCDVSPRKATPSDWFEYSLKQTSWLTQPIT